MLYLYGDQCIRGYKLRPQILYEMYYQMGQEKSELPSLPSRHHPNKIWNQNKKSLNSEEATEYEGSAFAPFQIQNHMETCIFYWYSLLAQLYRESNFHECTSKLIYLTLNLFILVTVFSFQQNNFYCTQINLNKPKYSPYISYSIPLHLTHPLSFLPHSARISFFFFPFWRCLHSFPPFLLFLFLYASYYIFQWLLCLLLSLLLYYLKMSFGSNNSRNIANLLRYEPLEPIHPKKNLNVPQPEPFISNSQKPRQQIPIEDVFTPDDSLEKRNYRRRTPMSSGNGGDGPLRATSRNEEMQLQGLKVRLDQVVKFYDERHNKLQTKFSVRLSELQNFVMKEVPKIDNANVLAADLIGCKEAIKEVRKQNDYQAQELAALKVIMEQKAPLDSLAIDSKQKQKMTVLFMQTVRLADSVQKIESGMGSLNRSYESKLQELDYKLVNAEKNIALMGQRSLNGNEVLSEFGDKVMDRLQTAENNLAILGKERIKDKEIINQLIAQNQRIGEDVQGLIKNLQGEFQNKLQNRISETVSRLMYEHEERINAQQEIKKNLDMRQRINVEKQNNDKQQFRARYENMDALVRNQLLKKQESIRGLHSLLEEQMRNTQKELLNEGNRRKQTENILRGQIRRVQESFRRQYDIYKAHQSDLVEKIGGVVKEEIQVRLNSELNLKKLTSDIANELVNDLNGVKEALSNTSKKLNLSIRQVANESSERAGQLSHYVDQEVKKVVDVVTEKYSKMKTVFTRLAEQLRNHLLNTETNRKNVEARLSNIEEDFDKMKNEVQKQIEEFYTDLEDRLKDEKQYVETVVFKKNNDLSMRVNKLEEYTNQYFELLKSNIEDNKELLNNKINNANESKPQESEEDIKELRTIVFNIRQLNEELKTESRESIEELRKEIKERNSELKKETLDRENQINEKIAKNRESIKEVEDSLNEVTIKVNSLRTEAGSENVISGDRIKRLSDEIDTLNLKLKEVEEKGAQNNRQNEEQIIKLRSDVTVLKGQVGALDDDIKRLSNS